MNAPAASKSPHFFERERDGSVRLRLRLLPEEAAMIEEAAGTTPLMSWIYNTLAEEAQRVIDANRDALANIKPPEGARENKSTPPGEDHLR